MLFLKKIHYNSAIVLSLFTGLHLMNHACSIWGVEKHIEVMNALRVLYRNPVAEGILISSVGIQIFTGVKLFIEARRSAVAVFERIALWTGIYLAFFFLIHLSAVMMGRLYFRLDTNFYFGVAGLNTFPLNLFFIPYYGLAVFSFFGHLAAVHYKKMKTPILKQSPERQAIFILFLGLILTLLLLYGLTNRFRGVSHPKEYQVLTGKS